MQCTISISIEWRHFWNILQYLNWHSEKLIDYILDKWGIKGDLLTPNTPLIHTSFTYSKLNMDEIRGLKVYLSYVHTSQKFLLKSLHAQKVSFLLLNLHFCAQKCKFSNKNDTFCAWRDFNKNFCDVCTYIKWNFQPQISPIFHIDYWVRKPSMNQ